MKKLLAVLLVIALCLPVLGMTAGAAEQKITMTSVEGAPGEEVTVSLSISGNPGIAYLKLEVGYDRNQLTLVSATNAGLLGGIFTTSQYIDVNPYVLQWMAAGNSNGDGLIATLKFRISETASAGKKTLTLSYDECYNQDLEDVVLSMVSGGVTVKIPPCATHTWDAGTVVQAGNCETDEVTQFTCTVCGEQKTEVTKKAAGHAFGDWTKVDGDTHKRVCSACGAEETEAHTWKLVSEKAPDCKNDGSRVFQCEACGASKTETIPSTGDHNFGSWTDNGNGTHTGTCSGCGVETTTEDHTFGAWSVTKAATCKEAGEETRVCTKCGSSQTRVIPVSTEHTYDDKWTDCGDGENHTHSCIICGQAPIQEAHKWDSGMVTTPATCTKDGVKTFACKLCKATKTEVIPATGKHDYTDHYEDSQDGKTHTAFCACGDSKVEAHDFSINGEVTVKPTTSKEGKQEMLCVCGAKTEITLPKKDANLDNVPKTGDITMDLILGGCAVAAMLACAWYLLRRKLAK